MENDINKLDPVTFGLLYDQLKEITEEHDVENFWRNVIKKLRWLINYEKLAYVVQMDCKYVVHSLHKQGIEVKEDLNLIGKILSKELYPSLLPQRLKWVENPTKKFQKFISHEPQIIDWILSDCASETILIVPFTNHDAVIGSLIFGIKNEACRNKMILSTLISIYASFVSMNFELLSELEQKKEQEQRLAEAEKMASLGKLVAGVAHEINTPVGNALTSASSIYERLNELENDYKNNKLTKSKIEKLISSGKKVSDIIVKNLQRASKLVTTFRKAAVLADEQPSQKKINLKQSLNLIIDDIKETCIKDKQVDIEIDCPEDLNILFDVQVLTDILVSFVTNSISHGFKNTNDNKITIKCVERKCTLILTFGDNGCGINNEIKEQIFDPFFTTSRCDGNIGLGLHIIYNLITQRYKGRLSCSNQNNPGVEFRIAIPGVVAGQKKILKNLV